LLADSWGLSLYAIEEQALAAGILPLRYARNRQTITLHKQRKLLGSRIAILGCGGLGGQVAELLARIGVGHLTLIDPDTFEEHNLNRQNFSTFDVIGQAKVLVLRQALTRFNPVIQIRPLIHRFDPADDMALITDADVVIDALDDPGLKRALAEQCYAQALPFVHGAIAGMDGQLAVNATLEHLYHDGGHGAEDTAGNLPFTAAFVAAMQAAEAVKLLTGIGESLTGEVLITDLMYDDFTRMKA
jgi:molybdopterin/thiamine biosynthesis adenylyltransferase